MSARRATTIAAVLAALVATGCGSTQTPDPTASPSALSSPTPTATATQSDEPTPSDEPSPDVLLIEVRDGQVVGGPASIETTVGSQVAFHVLSDVADEVHVHGVDQHVDVAPGVEATVTFTADIPGQFEIELEGAGLRLAELVVR